MGKRRSDYYLALTELADLSRRSAEILRHALERGLPRALPGALRELEELEAQAGELRRTFTRRLVREFVPPMDREDLLALFQALEELPHWAVLCLTALQGVSGPGLTACRAAERLARGCALLGEAVARLGERDPSPLLERTADVRTAIGEGERLALQAAARNPQAVPLLPPLSAALTACRIAADRLERGGIK